MVDYILMTWRLRPTSAYLRLPFPDDNYSAIGEWRDPNTTKPTKAALDAEWTVYQAEQTAANALATERTTRRDETKTRFEQLTQGLGALSVEDRSYAIVGRIMAYKDGANNAAILAITSKATAQAYVTGKSEWTAATAATRNLVADVLETMAGMVQVAMLTLE